MLAQPGGCVWTIYAAPQDAVARQFEDYRNAEVVGALKSAVGGRELEGLDLSEHNQEAYAGFQIFQTQ